jgi:hypothetical protein
MSYTVSEEFLASLRETNERLSFLSFGGSALSYDPINYGGLPALV